MRHFMGLLLSLVVLSWATGAQASIILSGENTAADAAGKDYATAATYTPNIVNNDLIDANSSTLASWTRDKNPFFEDITLNDGQGHPTTSAAGTYWPVTFGDKGKLPATYTYNLDVSTNPQGYDIQEIRSYAGWNENGSTLANQKYELLVSTLGNAEFTSLGTFTYTPFAATDTNTAAATKVTLTEDTTGVIASGVDALQFVLMDTGLAIGIDGNVYHEIDVIGVATVPEPATVWLLVTGGLTALVLLRHRQK